MSFYKQSAAVRLATPNEAEQVFDQLNPSSAPWGISLPPIAVSSLPQLIRYAPDRIKTGGFVECKGVGKDGIIKIKLEQLYALQFWSTILPVELFIWNSYRKEWTQVNLDYFMKTCETHGSLQQFPDNNKAAWFMHVDFLEGVVWTDHAT